jgi:hypothetical protein
MKSLTWKDYCPRMPKVMTWDEVKRRQINKEDEVNHPIKAWKPMKVVIPTYQRPYKSVGLYMFVKSILP